MIISGFSLGAAAALYAADMLEGRVQGYLLDAPYGSLRRAVHNRTRAKLPWGTEWLAYQGLCAAAPLVLQRPLDDYVPSRGLARIPTAVPVTLLGSTDDVACTPDELRDLGLGGEHSGLCILCRSRTGLFHRTGLSTQMTRR